MFLSAAGAAGSEVLGPESVFSTRLYTGNGGTQSIVNDIDLTEGGLVWTKRRDSSSNGGNTLYDTVRGTGSGGRLRSNDNQQAYSPSDAVTAFNNNGFSLGADASINGNGYEMVSWTFRKAPRFFDIVTYTGNGVAGRTISHNLESLVGMLMIKCISHSSDWSVQHRMILSNKYLALNEDTEQQTDTARFHSTAAGNSTFSVGSGNAVNGSGRTYVAYLFAHNNSGNPGEYGPDGDQDIIKCGSYTTSGSGTHTETLGWEPQFLMRKRYSGGSYGHQRNWEVFDTARGWYSNNDYSLEWNTEDEERSVGNQYNRTATGFTVHETGANVPYIYMAIRKPILTPEDATKVFNVQEYTGNGTDGRVITSGFQTDMAILKRHNDGSRDWHLVDKLRGGKGALQRFVPNDTTETGDPSNKVQEIDIPDGIEVGNDGDVNASPGKYIAYQWKQTGGYFDILRYAGTGSNRTISHNLQVVPEMMWIKAESSGGYDWMVYHNGIPSSTTAMQKLNEAGVGINRAALLNSIAPTATQINLGTDNLTNQNGVDYMAYLFATAPGVSKVGSYTGNGSARNIDCGFGNTARFVLIKNTQRGRAWNLIDTARGYGSGDDKVNYLSAQTQTLDLDYFDTYSSGFRITTSSDHVNANGENYIFYAIA